MKKIIKILVVVALPIFLSATLFSSVAKTNYQNKTIAVVNDDIMQKINNQLFPMGRQYIQSLYENNVSNGYNFQITNDSDAMNGVNNNKYLASITVPNDFSKSITSVNNVGKAVQGNIIVSYSDKILTNEKNMIGLMIEDSINNFSKKIVKEFVSTTFNGINQSMNTIKEKIKPAISGVDKLYKGSLELVNHNILLKSAGNKIIKGSKQLEKAHSQLSTGLKTLKNSTNKMPSTSQSNELVMYYKALDTFFANTDSVLLELKNAFCPSSSFCSDLTNIYNIFHQLSTLGESANDASIEIVKNLPELKSAISKLSSGANDLRKGTTKYIDGVNKYANNIDKYLNGVSEISKGVGELKNGFNEFSKAKISTYNDEVIKNTQGFISEPIKSTLLGKIFSENSTLNYLGIISLLIILLWISTMLCVFTLNYSNMGKNKYTFLVQLICSALIAFGIFISMRNTINCNFVFCLFLILASITFLLIQKALNLLFKKGGNFIICTVIAICIIINIFFDSKSFVSFFLSVLTPAYNGFENILIFDKSATKQIILLFLTCVLSLIIIILKSIKNKKISIR